MLAYSQCSDCKELLQVCWVGQQTHPHCRQTEEELKLRAFVDAAQRGDDAAADQLEREINRAPTVPLGSAALWYASQGWPVLPLLPGDKRPATKNGLHDACTDRERIRAYWQAHPEANIGLRTGVKFDCVDIDGKLGFESASTVEFPPVHGKVMTPRGAHLYILPTGIGNRVGAMPGIDVRSTNGYVVAPPSRIGFKSYSWAIKPSPEILGSVP